MNWKQAWVGFGAVFLTVGIVTYAGPSIWAGLNRTQQITGGELIPLEAVNSTLGALVIGSAIVGGLVWGWLRRNEQ